MVEVIDVTREKEEENVKRKKVTNFAKEFFNSREDYRFLVGDTHFENLNIEVEIKNESGEPRILQVGYCDLNSNRVYLNKKEFEGIILNFAKKYEQEILGINPEDEKKGLTKIINKIIGFPTKKRGVIIQTDYSQ